MPAAATSAPKPNQTTQRASLIPYHLRTFLGGQSDYEDKGVAGSYKFAYNIDPRKQVDSITCGQGLKDLIALGTLTGAPKFMIPASDGNTYVFCYDGTIYRINSSGVAALVYTDTQESGHISGAGEWYGSDGYTYLLWATDTRLNIKKIVGPAYSQTEPWNDVNTAATGSWPKTNLTTGFPHTMIMANGVFLIANGNWLALVGYDMSYSNQSLQLIPGNTAQSIVERGLYGIIGCNRIDAKAETAFFQWDGIAQHWNNKEIIKFKGLNCMLDTEIAIAQIGNFGQIYISDFNTPIPFRQIRGGGQSDVDGICGYKGMALLGIYSNTNLINGVYANGVYSIGRVNKNAPLILNLEYQLTCDEIYSVKTVGTDIYIAYKLGSAYGIKVVDTSNKADAIYTTLDLIAPLGTRRYPIPIGRMLNWQRIDLQCQPLPAGCAIEAWYKIDKQTTGGANNDGWVQANADPLYSNGGLQFNQTGFQNAVFYTGQRGRTIEVMLKLFHNGNNTPEVNEINVYFTVG